MRTVLMLCLLFVSSPTSQVFAEEPARANGDTEEVNASVRATLFQDVVAREVARLGSRTTRLERGAAAQSSKGGRWVARHPVWTMVLIGAAGGAAIGMASCSNAPEFAGLCALTGAGAGAGAGGLAGLVLTRR
jgi:hypothetical protein